MAKRTKREDPPVNGHDVHIQQGPGQEGFNHLAHALAGAQIPQEGLPKERKREPEVQPAPQRSLEERAGERAYFMWEAEGRRENESQEVMADRYRRAMDKIKAEDQQATQAEIRPQAPSRGLKKGPERPARKEAPSEALPTVAETLEIAVGSLVRVRYGREIVEARVRIIEDGTLLLANPETGRPLINIARADGYWNVNDLLQENGKALVLDRNVVVAGQEKPASSDPMADVLREVLDNSGKDTEGDNEDEEEESGEVGEIDLSGEAVLHATPYSEMRDVLGSDTWLKAYIIPEKKPKKKGEAEGETAEAPKEIGVAMEVKAVLITDKRTGRKIVAFKVECLAVNDEDDPTISQVSFHPGDYIVIDKEKGRIEPRMTGKSDLPTVFRNQENYDKLLKLEAAFREQKKGEVSEETPNGIRVDRTYPRDRREMLASADTLVLITNWQSRHWAREEAKPVIDQIQALRTAVADRGGAHKPEARKSSKRLRRLYQEAQGLSQTGEVGIALQVQPWRDKPGKDGKIIGLRITRVGYNPGINSESINGVKPREDLIRFQKSRLVLTTNGGQPADPTLMQWLDTPDNVGKAARLMRLSEGQARDFVQASENRAKKRQPHTAQGLEIVPFQRHKAAIAALDNWLEGSDGRSAVNVWAEYEGGKLVGLRPIAVSLEKKAAPSSITALEPDDLILVDANGVVQPKTKKGVDITSSFRTTVAYKVECLLERTKPKKGGEKRKAPEGKGGPAAAEPKRTEEPKTRPEPASGVEEVKPLEIQAYATQREAIVNSANWLEGIDSGIAALKDTENKTKIEELRGQLPGFKAELASLAAEAKGIDAANTAAIADCRTRTVDCKRRISAVQRELRRLETGEVETAVRVTPVYTGSGDARTLEGFRVTAVALARDVVPEGFTNLAPDDRILVDAQGNILPQTKNGVAVPDTFRHSRNAEKIKTLLNPPKK